MESDSADKDGAADRYATDLPDRMDLLFLSMGEDGHIASLFPHSAALKETNKRVLAILGPKPPYQRLTITPPVIRNARHVLVMALGQQKRALYEEALRNPNAIDTLPARMVLDRTWIFGE
jgi:6-phosphogluconolactonase